MPEEAAIARLEGDSKGLPPSYIKKDIGTSEGSLYGEGRGVEISCSQARTAPIL